MACQSCQERHAAMMKKIRELGGKIIFGGKRQLSQPGAKAADVKDQ